MVPVEQGGGARGWNASGVERRRKSDAAGKVQRDVFVVL